MTGVVRRLSRPLAVAAVLGLAVGTGTFTGAGVATGAQPADARFGYTCQFPSGPQPVGLVVTATFPENVTEGEAIQPTDVAATVSVPPAGHADLTALGAAVVTGIAALGTKATQGQYWTDAGWSGLEVPATPVPEAGDLVLAAAGPVLPVNASSPGDVVFAVGDLELVLTPRRADESATDPSTMRITCALDPDQPTTIATVPVVAASSSEPSEPASPETEGGAIELGPGAAASEAPRPRAQGEPPPGCFDPPRPEPAGPACAYLAGRANIDKLNASVMLGFEAQEPNAHLSVGDRVEPVTCEPSPDYVCVYRLDTYSSASVTMPPTESTFLAFGFVPVRATMHMTELARTEILSRSERHAYPDGSNLYPIFVSATTPMSARVYDVAVNGVPLGLDRTCTSGRPGDPIAVELSGGAANSIPDDPSEYTVSFGGQLRGTASIPAFSGCDRSGEDLSPLFTGMVSSGDNYVRLTQGLPCFRDGDGECPPPEVEPEPEP